MNTTVQHYPSGSTPTEFLPGDFLLVHGTTFFDRVIQFGQSLRVHDPHFYRWNHAVLIVDVDGKTVEADKSIKKTWLKDYENKDYMLVRIEAPDDQRRNSVAFAISCLGEEYGILTFISVAWSLLTGSKFSIGLSGQEICSGLVGRALERTGFIPNNGRDASHLSPAELARHFLEFLSPAASIK